MPWPSYGRGSATLEALAGRPAMHVVSLAASLPRGCLWVAMDIRLSQRHAATISDIEYSFPSQAHYESCIGLETGCLGLWMLNPWS